MQEDADRGRVDTDPTAMWIPGQDSGQGRRKRRAVTGEDQNDQNTLPGVQTGMHRVEELAQLSGINIQHKDQLAVFVPASFIGLLAADRGLFANPGFHQSASKRSGRKHN